MGWSELFDLKRIFGVSVQGAHLPLQGPWRLRARRSCGSCSTSSLRRGWRKPAIQGSRGPCPANAPFVFERLCFRALAERAISEAKAAELLGHSVHELNRRMDGTPRRGANRGSLTAVKVLVADTSVLIDIDRGSLVEPAFRLPFEFTVPRPALRTRAQGPRRRGSRPARASRRGA